MKTVKEVSRLTGLSVRALHHYDAIGLLRPSRTTPAGYRLYDDAALERLQMILLFRELEFPLEQIRQILDAPGFDRRLALMQQLELLEMKRERLTALIDLTRGLQSIGGNNMDFSAFDRTRLDEYAARAREAWGDTPAYSLTTRSSCRVLRPASPASDGMAAAPRLSRSACVAASKRRFSSARSRRASSSPSASAMRARIVASPGSRSSSAVQSQPNRSRASIYPLSVPCIASSAKRYADQA